MTIDFALLGHPASLDHVINLLPRFKPELEAMQSRRSMVAAAFEAMGPFTTEDLLIVSKPDGKPVRGRLIICPFLPEHVQSPAGLSAANRKTRAGIALAKELGAKIVGLGGFTSIVGGAEGERLPQEFGLAITSGNTLTAALAMTQMQSLLTRLDWSLEGRTVAVVGATGDIGRACTLALVSEHKASRLILIARNRAKLDALCDEIRSSYGDSVSTWASTDVKDAARADLIVTAASAASPLFSEGGLMPGTIVCDISYPSTLAYASEPRPEVIAFQGGLATTGSPLPILDYTLLPSANLLHGCFAETITLALAERYESYSIGQGHITPERMQDIYKLARAYRFNAAPVYKGKHRLVDDDLSAFLRYAEALREDR